MKLNLYKKKLKNLKHKNNNKVLLVSLLLFAFIPVFAFGEIKYADDIYKIAETNGIAVSICKAIEIGTILMVPLFAIMFTMLGFSAYQGKLQWTSFVTFAIGIAAFKGAGNIAEFFMPQMGLQYGCKCAIEKQIRDENGVITRVATGVNYDCTDGEADYKAEYGS